MSEDVTVSEWTKSSQKLTWTIFLRVLGLAIQVANRLGKECNARNQVIVLGIYIQASYTDQSTIDDAESRHEGRWKRLQEPDGIAPVRGLWSLDSNGATPSAMTMTALMDAVVGLLGRILLGRRERRSQKPSPTNTTQHSRNRSSVFERKSMHWTKFVEGSRDVISDVSISEIVSSCSKEAPNS